MRVDRNEYPPKMPSVDVIEPAEIVTLPVGKTTSLFGFLGISKRETRVVFPLYIPRERILDDDDPEYLMLEP